jgi:hypothetical protein
MKSRKEEKAGKVKRRQKNAGGAILCSLYASLHAIVNRDAIYVNSLTFTHSSFVIGRSSAFSIQGIIGFPLHVMQSIM